MICPKYSTFNNFRAWTASNEIHSTYAQRAMKQIPRLLNQRWNSFRVCSAYFEWWFWNGLWLPLMLRMREIWLLVDWTCAKIGYLLAEQVRMCEKWLFVGWACAKIVYSVAEHTRKSFWRTTCIFRVSEVNLLELRQKIDWSIRMTS
jgi:hypothetical protein